MIRELVGVGIGVASKVRGTKVFHPHGVVHEATVRITAAPGAPEGVPLLRERAEHRAIVRLSRGAGVPRPLPDVRGLALRILDAHGQGRHQDLLLVTSGDGPVVQHLLLPARGFASLPYSSLTPYRIDGRLYILGAYARPSVAWRGGGDREQLAALAKSGRVAFDLAIARLGGRLRPIGSITLGRRLDDAENAIGFDPWNTGGGLEPATFLNDWRRAAYPASQAGRAGADPSALTDQGA